MEMDLARIAWSMPVLVESRPAANVWNGWKADISASVMLSRMVDAVLDAPATLAKGLVLLQPRYSKAGHAASMNRSLPAGELFEAQRVAIASFIEGQKASIDGCNNLSFSSYCPPRGVFRGEHLARETFANRTDYICRAAFLMFEHRSVPRENIREARTEA